MIYDDFDDIYIFEYQPEPAINIGKNEEKCEGE